MKIQTTHIYNNTTCYSQIVTHKKSCKRLVYLLGLALIIAPFGNLKGLSVQQPTAQNFAITAYYSPLPGQCCYVKGGLQADKILNGEGHTAADGTPVYPGLIAAPPSYPFGTVVHLPGFGTFKVHDRGGAIQEWNNGKHRLDLWVGFGEEGLARALNLGIKDIQGTIYPPGTDHPPVDFSFDSLSAPDFQLKRFLINENLLAVTPGYNESGLSVRMLQEHLHQLGYLQEEPNGYFGDQTKAAYTRFLSDYKIDASPEVLTPTAASYLLAAVNRRGKTIPLSEHVDATSSAKEISEAQRLLRYLRYYNGRITGVYTEDLQQAILRFQQEKQLVGTANDPGAGRIGPITTVALANAWNKKIAKSNANNYKVYAEVDKTLKQRDWLIDSFLSEGYSGKSVLALQHTLADLGFFEKSEANGYFGQITKAAVTEYQLSRNIISTSNASFAGVVGPKTLTVLQTEQRSKHYKIAKAEGLEAL